MAEEIENLVPDDEATESKEPVVILLEEEKPAEGKPEPKIVQDAASEGVEAMARNLEEAKKKADSESQNRAAAERRAADAEARATTAESKISAQTQQNIDANRTAATNAMDAAKVRREQAKKDYIALQAEGKFEEAFEATQVASKAQQEIAGAEGYLAQLEAAVERLKAEPAEKPASATTDPVTGITFTPKTFDWVKSQGDKWKDQDFRIECDAATRSAKRNGIALDTPEFFEHVESRLQAAGFLEAAETEGEDVEEKPKPQAVVPKKAPGASTGAPPTRAVAGSTGVAKKGVKLSGAEREVAQAIVDSLPDVFKGENPDQLYARNKQALINEYGEDYGKQAKQ